MKEFAAILDKVFNECIKRKNKNTNNNDTYNKNYIVHNIEIVEKIDFYGYHSHKDKFLKIYVYNP